MLVLGCGPFFSTAGLWMSLFILLLVKPATYFAFIQAFRFRVSRDIPMSFKRALGITIARTVIGAGLLGAVAAVATMLPGAARSEPLLWGALCVERLALWLCLGLYVGLRPRRLIGWTISGVCIDLAYDVAVGVSLADKWLIHSAILAAVFVFILVLHQIGRRESLRARFSVTTRCGKCGYDLAGNLSGVCPECGTAIAAQPSAQAA